MDLHTLSWTLIEGAAVPDQGQEEETALASIVRSYLLRRGLVDTLATFEAEWQEGLTRNTAKVDRQPEGCKAEWDDGDANLQTSTTDSKTFLTLEALEEARRRKEAQLLCLSGKYSEAAAMLASGSVLKIKLLCMAALQQEDVTKAMMWLAEHVAPLIPLSEDPCGSNQLYLQTVSSIVTADESPLTSHEKRRQIATEVNEALLPQPTPSALNVLLSWADWQEAFLSIST